MLLYYLDLVFGTHGFDISRTLNLLRYHRKSIILLKLGNKIIVLYTWHSEHEYRMRETLFEFPSSVCDYGRIKVICVFVCEKGRVFRMDAYSYFLKVVV